MNGSYATHEDRPITLLCAIAFAVAGQAWGPPAAAADLPTQAVGAIRQAIENCGGTLTTDTAGQPIEVDLAVDRGSADMAAYKAALACAGLRKLRVRAAQISAGDLAKLASLTRLEELLIEDAALDDEVLSRIVRSVPALRRLALRNAFDVTDRGIAAVATLPHLTHLSLIDLQIGGRALSSLAKLPTLASLDLRMCSNVKGGDLAVLRSLPKLKELKLSGYDIDDAALELLATLPHLESLTIEDASIGAQGLAGFVRNEQVAQRLRILSIARCAGVDDAALRSLAALRNLRRLTLRDVPVTGTFLRDLKSPERLELLSLNQTFLNDEAYESMAACRALKRLEVAQNLLTPAAMDKMGALSDLEYINLTDCGLNDQLLESLDGLQKLKTLIVDGNPNISREAVDKLLGKSRR